MRKIFFTTCLIICYTVVTAQNLVTEQNGRVTVRNINDSVVVEIEPNGSAAIAAAFNNNKSEMTVMYSTGKVVIKDAEGNYVVEIAEEGISDKAVDAVWQGDSIYITTQSQQVLIKNSQEWRQ